MVLLGELDELALAHIVTKPKPLLAHARADLDSWVEVRWRRTDSQWEAFRPAATDLRLDIRISDLNEEESHCLLPISKSEGGSEAPETQRAFTTHREPLTSPPSIATQEGQSTELPDEPEAMATQTHEVEEEIIIRAESLHISDQPNRVDEERINPSTGHMEPGDAAAINRAAGPD